MSLMPKARGFTLIELLISISIIAILSAIGLVAYSTVLKQGRDSKRQSDLRSIQSALEQYYAKQFSYPSGLTALSSGGYINIVPTDPDPSRNYYYLQSGTSYCLYAQLENLTSTNLNGCSPHSPHNFAVTPP